MAKANASVVGSAAEPSKEGKKRKVRGDESLRKVLDEMMLAMESGIVYLEDNIENNGAKQIVNRKRMSELALAWRLELCRSS